MTTRDSIAVAQTVPRRGEVEANVEEHLRLARTAGKEGAQVLVFPELSLTCYELDLARKLAFTENDTRLTPLRDLAAESGLTLVVGAPARHEERVHIGAFILAPDRSVELYTKHHLGAFPADVNPGGSVPPPEATVFDPGDRNPLLRVGDRRFALAVCADTGHPSHAETAAGRGATGYLASMFVIPSELESEVARLRGYATRHAMTVAMANFGGPTGGLPSAGRSAIWSETSELLAELPERGAGIAIATEHTTGWRGRAIPLTCP